MGIASDRFPDIAQKEQQGRGHTSQMYPAIDWRKHSVDAFTLFAMAKQPPRKTTIRNEYASRT